MCIFEHHIFITCRDNHSYTYPATDDHQPRHECQNIRHKFLYLVEPCPICHQRTHHGDRRRQSIGSMIEEFFDAQSQLHNVRKQRWQIREDNSEDRSLLNSAQMTIALQRLNSKERGLDLALFRLERQMREMRGLSPVPA